MMMMIPVIETTIKQSFNARSVSTFGVAFFLRFSFSIVGEFSMAEGKSLMSGVQALIRLSPTRILRLCSAFNSSAAHEISCSSIHKNNFQFNCLVFIQFAFVLRNLLLSSEPSQFLSLYATADDPSCVFIKMSLPFCGL